MRKNQRVPVIRMLFPALFVSVFFFAATAHAQGDLPVYGGKFTLPYRVHWGESVLEAGDYTIRINSTGTPIIALVRKVNGDALTRVISGSRTKQTNGINALLIREKDGQLTVHSLSLSDLGLVVIYDPSLAQEPVREVRESRTIPVMSARM
jgi:hypothetical protein